MRREVILMVDNQLERAISLVNEGQNRLQASEFWGARGCYEKALGIFRQLPGAEKHQAYCHYNIALILLSRELRDAGEARSHLERALSLFRNIPGSEIDCALCNAHMGSLSSEMGDYEEAEKYFAHVLTLFEEAIRTNDITTVEIITDRIAGVSSRNRKGRTPLHIAAYHGAVEVTGFLLSRGAPLDARDRIGNTPLHLAAHQGNLTVAKMLISLGASVDVRDNDGKSPLDWAQRKGRKGMIEYLQFVTIMKRSFAS
jgi:tetratricopeptide (TPR) repeat protein